MRIHFIAIGGSAMHNLAIALQLAGHQVTGSDDEIFEPSRSRLAAYNLLPPEEGWFPEKITKQLDAIILGMHARANNPELLKAQADGLHVMSYPEFLAAHARNKKRVVIGGSHGKTTITSMVMHVLKELNMDFDYLVGSKVKNFDVMVRLSSTAPVMVFEGDEYLSSPIDLRPKFHWYKPHLALVSGIAWDHMNVFPDFENYKLQFEVFIRDIEPGGTLYYYSGDKVLTDIVVNHARVNVLPYDEHPNKNIEGVACLIVGDESIPLPFFGKHNLENVNGARLICNNLGVSDADFYDAIQSFEGAANRLEKVYGDESFVYFRDFAHAPSKVRATLAAVRRQFADYHVIACFELHTYSSLNQQFLGQYEGALAEANAACVYFNPHALALKKLPMLDAGQVKVAFKRDDLEVFNSSVKMVNWLQNCIGEKTVVLMMSSGNFDGIDHAELAKKLSR